MGRLLVVLLALAALASSDVRARIRPHVQWLLDPVYEWSTGPKVNEIANDLDTSRAGGGSLPASDRDLHVFLRTRYHQEEAALDPWGVPYFVVRDPGGVKVASAGRDRTPRTGDDLVSHAVSLLR